MRAYKYTLYIIFLGVTRSAVLKLKEKKVAEIRRLEEVKMQNADRRRRKLVSEAKGKKKRQDELQKVQRLSEWEDLTASNATHQWQLIQSQILQKRYILKATHRILLATGKYYRLKPLAKLIKEIEQLENELKKAKDLPASIVSPPSTEEDSLPAEEGA